ncbi:OadG family protein [Romboutsia ilealis]|uniref:OadG family protein n=1 Tax=Romboutsia ilealis TaxID=1115758 RepID=UPI0024957498|nr:OadG family transporter subunit [Romboutsia ilealis]
MGENLNLIQALYITISSMAMVFIILLVISGVLSLFKYIFKKENDVKASNVKDISKGTVNNIKNDSVQENINIDEDEKIVVALAASIMAGDGTPNPNLHIKRITRIS